jgi:hypothetical protein
MIAQEEGDVKNVDRHNRFPVPERADQQVYYIPTPKS